MTLAGLMLLSGIGLLQDIIAQVPKQAQIAFCSDRDGDFEIYIMDPDGGNLHKLTNNNVEDYQIAWSPDGQRIAFCRGSGFYTWSDDWQIYVMDIEGGNLGRLSNNPSYDAHPSWSPDGQRIVFDSERNGNREIYVMDANGKNQRRVTNNPSWDGDPEWSPSGEKIVFMSERDGNKEIYVIDADGKNPRNLTENSAIDGSAYWFDPAFAVPVSPAGKLRWLWRWLKQER